VATGKFSAEALAGAGADVALADLSDTAGVLALLKTRPETLSPRL
jgi:hypothetical protein